MKAEAEIEEAGNRLEAAFTGLPGRALGSAVSMVAGAVVSGFQSHKKEEEEEAAYAASLKPEENSFSETLKSVGSETALFALSKLVEKLLAQHR